MSATKRLKLRVKKKNEDKLKYDGLTITCPFTDCGRKFPTESQLSDHID